MVEGPHGVQPHVLRVGGVGQDVAPRRRAALAVGVGQREDGPDPHEPAPRPWHSLMLLPSFSSSGDFSLSSDFPALSKTWLIFALICWADWANDAGSDVGMAAMSPLMSSSPDRDC